MGRAYVFSCDSCGFQRQTDTIGKPHNWADVAIRISGYVNWGAHSGHYGAEQVADLLLCSDCQTTLQRFIRLPKGWHGVTECRTAPAETAAPAEPAAVEEPAPIVDAPAGREPAPLAEVLPDPPAPAEPAPERRPGLPNLTANQEKVFDHLCLCAVKTGSETVTIDLQTLAAKSGVAYGNLSYVLGELQRKMLIDWKKGGLKASPTFTVHGALDALDA